MEWPFGGIELTITELDGAAIVAAASRSACYWPETEQGIETELWPPDNSTSLLRHQGQSIQPSKG